jgi:hypothetical protein
MLMIALATAVVGTAIFLMNRGDNEATPVAASSPQEEMTVSLGETEADQALGAEGTDQASMIAQRTGPETETAVVPETVEATSESAESELALAPPQETVESGGPDLSESAETAATDMSITTVVEAEAPMTAMAVESPAPSESAERSDGPVGIDVVLEPQEEAADTRPDETLAAAVGPGPTAGPAAQPGTSALSADEAGDFKEARNAVPAPSVDETTQGAWVGAYGECGYILAAYNHDKPTCELPLLPDGTPCDPATCPSGTDITCGAGNYRGGAPLSLVDCRDLDIDGDGDQDLFYDVYAGPYNAGSTMRILENPDDTCNDVNGIWFSYPNGIGRVMKYEIGGVVGQHRMAIYMMSADNHSRRQSVQVFVGNGGDLIDDNASDPANVDYDYWGGTYEFFDVDVAAGEVITVAHTNTAGANAVVSGVFFDSGFSPLCTNGKACYSGATPDMTTRGDWVGTYGGDGYIIFNRINGPAKNLIGEAAEATTLIGGFPGTVTVDVIQNVNTWIWSIAGETCSGGGSRPAGSQNAMGYVWECNTADPRALAQPPGGCDNAQNCASAFTNPVASTWDDAGERSGSLGPDLFVDIEVDLEGLWELSIYAVDYDSGVRRQKYHLYDYHTNTPVEAPVDIGAFSGGEYVTYTLEGPFQVTLRAEYYAGANAIISGIFVDPAEGYTCEGGPVNGDCDLDDYCTYTQGGWGTTAHGSNPGSIRDAFWDEVYGAEGLVIDSAACDTHLVFAGPGSVEAFLPCGGTPAAIPADRIAPDGSVEPICVVGKGRNRSGLGVLASQITALRLNVDYSAPGVLLPEGFTGPTLRDLIIASGPFADLTVEEFLIQAQEALLCGDTEVPGLGTFPFADFNDAATAINENFDDCIDNLGFLLCPDDGGGGGPGDCAISVTKDATAGQDLNGDGLAPDLYPGDDLQFTIVVEASSDLEDVLVTDTLPTFEIAGITFDAYTVDLDSFAFTPHQDIFFPPDENTNVIWDDASNTLTFVIGDMLDGSAVSISYSVQLNLLAPIGGQMINTVVADGICLGTGVSVADYDENGIWVAPGPNNNLAGDDIGTPGFWCTHIDQSKRNSFTEDEINTWLEDINIASLWFSEEEDASELILAQGIICDAQAPDDESKLERHLLTLWFNVATANVWTDIQLGQLCPGPSDITEPRMTLPIGADPSLTVGEVVVAAEQALLTGDSANYLFWKDVADYINNAWNPIDQDGDGINGLQNDPVVTGDDRFDGLPCDPHPVEDEDSSIAEPSEGDVKD